MNEERPSPDDNLGQPDFSMGFDQIPEEDNFADLGESMMDTDGPEIGQELNDEPTRVERLDMMPMEWDLENDLDEWIPVFDENMEQVNPAPPIIDELPAEEEEELAQMERDMRAKCRWPEKLLDMQDTGAKYTYDPRTKFSTAPRPQRMPKGQAFPAKMTPEIFFSIVDAHVRTNPRSKKGKKRDAAKV